MTTFKDLKIGTVFNFERDTVCGVLRSLAEGPWVKLSGRKYRRYDQQIEHRVGTIHVEVRHSPLHLDDDKIEAVKIDRSRPQYGMAADGYTKRSGATTDYYVRLVGEKRWRRVYVIQFSNAGSAYVRKDKLEWFLSDFFREGKLIDENGSNLPA